MIVETDWLAEKLTGRETKAIAVETARLIRTGELPVGARLPSLRDLAFHIGVSPATISNAWQELRRQKIVSGRGRNGTFVIGDMLGRLPTRMARVGNFAAGALDLTLAVPDPALLPPLEAALRAAAASPLLNSYQRSRIEPQLQAAVLATWPYRPAAMLATNGGYNAVYSAIHALIMPGDPVAVEEPTTLRILDILEDVGARILPVPCDTEGPLPGPLAAALAHQPTLFIYQPRSHSVTGHHVTASRMLALSKLLEGTSTLVLEDDGLGDISAHPPASLGVWHPERTIHIRSFSKSLGPDLRLGVMSAPEAIIDKVQSYRLFSAGWTSRLLQNAAAWLLGDPATQTSLGRARSIYAERRDRLAQALAQEGISTAPGDALSLWLPVPDERFAVVTLAAHGIAVLPGEKFFVKGTGFIRIGTGQLKSDFDHIAHAVALACDPRH